MKKSETICAIPWIHMNIIPGGKVYHCCVNSDLEYFVGDLSTQSIEEVWNSDNFKDIRKKMINGERPHVCSKCYEREDSSGRSSRTDQNLFFNDTLREIPLITNDDGSVEDINLKYWDFRFSNLCNYKCRTCGPAFSSSWIPDAKKMGWLKNQDISKTIELESVENISRIQFLENHVHEVEKIYFAGGEPLLMDEHWYILDILDKAERYNTVITYNTNMSTLEYKGKSVLDFWRKWGHNIWLWPSIDEIDERAELIRSGTVWSKVETNLKKVSELNIHVRPSITVSAMNVHRIPEIIDRLIELGAVNPTKQFFSLNIVEYSPHFHVSILPDSTREKVKIKLESYIKQYDEKYGTNVEENFSHLFWHMEKPHNPVNKQSFLEFTKRIDSIREEDTFKVIPELEEMLNG